MDEKDLNEKNERIYIAYMKGILSIIEGDLSGIDEGDLRCR